MDDTVRIYSIHYMQIQDSLPTIKYSPSELPADLRQCLDTDAHWEAAAHLPSANRARTDFMDCETTDESGRRMIVTYQRQLHKWQNARWYAWIIHSARYAE